MVQVVHLNQEQLALVDRLKAEEQKFIANPALIGSEAAIAAARALIDRAIADKLPEVAFVVGVDGPRYGIKMCQSES